MSAGDVYENRYLDAGFGDKRSTLAGFPSTVYIALFTAAPADAGGGTEVSGGAYARVAVANSSVNWPDATAGQKKNATAITFNEATASWGTISHFAIFDALTGGSIIHHGALSSAVPISTGQTPVFNANAIVITAD